jgi:hypothetical protein
MLFWLSTGAHAYAQPRGIDVCYGALTYGQDARLFVPRHDAGDGVQIVPECRQAVASVTCRALPGGGQEQRGLQGRHQGRTGRRVSSVYTTLANNSPVSAVILKEFLKPFMSVQYNNLN